MVSPLSGLKNASAAHTSRSGGWETAGADYRNALKNKSEAIELEQASKVVKSQEAIEEQIARRVAMKAATDNAEEMIKTLTRQYNRARQAQITKEIAEVIGGVEALK